MRDRPWLAYGDHVSPTLIDLFAGCGGPHRGVRPARLHAGARRRAQPARRGDVRAELRRGAHALGRRRRPRRRAASRRRDRRPALPGLLQPGQQEPRRPAQPAVAAVPARGAGRPAAGVRDRERGPVPPQRRVRPTPGAGRPRRDRRLHAHPRRAAGRRLRGAAAARPHDRHRLARRADRAAAAHPPRRGTWRTVRDAIADLPRAARHHRAARDDGRGVRPPGTRPVQGAATCTSAVGRGSSRCAATTACPPAAAASTSPTTCSPAAGGTSRPAPPT